MRVRTYDPFRELDRFFGPVSNRPMTASRPTVPLDVVRTEDHVELYFDLPGVDVDSIELTVEKRELKLEAERTFAPSEGQTVRGERRHGTFSRKLMLAENLDTEGLVAEYHDGVLVVTIPVAAEAKPRKIEIGSSPAEIEA